MMSRISAAVVLCSLLAVSQAQVAKLGSCPSNVAAKQNFVASDFLGTWYEQEKYFALFQLFGDCVTAEYSLNTDGTIAVHNEQKNTITGEQVEIDGTATPTSTTGEGKLAVTFPTSVLTSWVEAPYWVLDTDYINYAVIYGCNDFSVVHAENAWILTRERNMTEEIKATAYAVFEANGLDTSGLIVTDQTNCS